MQVLASERDGYPMISGHRGAGGYAPENTMAAFQVGHQVGADLLEMDVQLTKDGHLVVIHDHVLDRTTNGTGFVGTKTLSELMSLDAGSWFDRRFSGERIPVLDDVVAWSKGKIGLNIELKSGPYPFFHPELPEKVIAVLRKHDVIAQTLIISFDHTLIRHVKTLEPGIACAIIFNARVVDPIGLAKVSRADVLNISRGFVSPDLVSLAHAHGLGVQCYCDDPEEAQVLTRLGVDFMDSDHPDRIRAAARAVPREEIGDMPKLHDALERFLRSSQ